MTKVVKVVDEARVQFATVFNVLQNTVEVTNDTKACFAEIEVATNKWLKSEKSLDDLLAFREASDAFFASLRTYQHEAPYQDALLEFQAHLKF